MEKKIGFIGCGNMGKAILGGLIASGQVLPGQIWVYTPSPDKVAALHDQYGINAAQNAQEVAQIADIVFGAVKPGIMVKVLSEISSSLNKDSLVVSIAAGVTLDQLARALGHDRKNYSRHAEYAIAGQRRDDLRHTQCAGNAGRYS
ncbi:pyrroline-5-carboxylate reductase [Salmonella enterica subsp. arizonae]|uniref:Pyrroline-5-carboxylate reductase n=1 Tax=Salmonella enterica subsp. arizonae TaxID=59203 RepID=A0A379S6Q7_SALER|nr:pyrroline-5-carboxylate reductase [Salmonella enterica subsp. arizonae]